MDRSLTQEQLRTLLSYDAETGQFRWLRRRNGVRADLSAGSRHCEGYVEIGINGRSYLAHRLAWLFVHGQWPDAEIDHKNGDRTDNRLGNLRCVTRQHNLMNQRRPRSNNTTGYLGVCVDRERGGFQAKLQASGRAHHLGRFDTPEAAHAAYVAAKRRMHPTCSL